MRRITRGTAFPMGASIIGNNKVQFVISGSKGKEYGLVLYDNKTGNREEILLKDEYRIGNLYSIVLDEIKIENLSYNFLIDGVEKTDSYAKVIYGKEGWGKKSSGPIRAGICLKEYDWTGDYSPAHRMEDSIFYQLHVRGFTKHSSSGVKRKGTFEGIVEKIPYLTELGITALELLPAYEFCEMENHELSPFSKEEIKNKGIYKEKTDSVKINYWGYKEAFYFVPKFAYSSGKDASESFKNMVKELHKEGIEVIMQFFFPINISRAFIIQVLQFWLKEYHIDGFRLLGVNIPVELIASMNEFQNVKIMYENIKEQEVYDYQQIPYFHNLANYNDSYMYSLRKFLKSDVGSLQQAFFDMMDSGNKVKRINYLTNYNTFTLWDLVSYDRKHNEENKEGGTDGNDYNVSWNCGVEGNTRKKSVLELREQQRKNAITFLLLSKGTPVILSGDEFGNSQSGNNNPYCQDNLISWLNWKDLERNKEYFEFCKNLISLRKKEKFYLIDKNNIRNEEYRGFPVISFHGKEAWKLDWTAANEEAGGILYFKDNRYMYIGINMHWEETALALPNLSLEGKWKVEIITSKNKCEKQWKTGEKMITIPARSIIVLMAGGKEKNVKGISAF